MTSFSGDGLDGVLNEPCDACKLDKSAFIIVKLHYNAHGDLPNRKLTCSYNVEHHLTGRKTYPDNGVFILFRSRFGIVVSVSIHQLVINVPT